MSERVAVVGATGVVGEELLGVLKEREFPIARLSLFASERSEGRRLLFGDTSIACQVSDSDRVADHDVVFLSAGASISRNLRAALDASGARVADNTSAFRLAPDVPLVVPEINGDQVRSDTPYVAVPNCTAILLCLALAPLEREYGLRRVVVSTYQAISGAGRRAVEALRVQTRLGLEGGVSPESVPLAFNAIPAIGEAEPLASGEGWTTGEEAKVVAEARRILGRAELPMVATCVRIPVLRAHSESVLVETVRPCGSVAEVQELFRASAGVELRDALERGTFPHPQGAAGIDGIHVGRIRRVGDALSFFLVGDQLRKGAALNAVQIAELHLKERDERPGLTGAPRGH